MFPAHLDTCRVKVMGIGWSLTDNETEVQVSNLFKVTFAKGKVRLFLLEVVAEAVVSVSCLLSLPSIRLLAS